MKPLILEYAENPVVHEIDFSLVEYSQGKNLNVLKGTETPAVIATGMDTQTFTRTVSETDDEDNSGVKLRNTVDTQSYTLNSQEPTDSDNDLKRFTLLLDTQLITESRESTDSDKGK